MACRRSLPQSELQRFRRDDSGQWLLDLGRRSSGGRGAWLCHAPECRTNKGLGRFFRAQAARIAEELSGLRDEKNGGLNV